MDSENLTDNLKKNFKNFLEEIYKLYDNDDDKKKYINNLKNNNNENMNIMNNFHKSLESNDLFKLFKRSKIKLFSSKQKETNNVSESMFGSEHTLKDIFNNRSNEIKKNLWKMILLKFYFGLTLIAI